MVFRRNWESILLGAVALLALTLRLALWLRGPATLDHLTLIDDSYLSLHLARSIAEGAGPWYGLAPTNGFQPAFVFLVAPAFWIWPHDPDGPLRAALALTALFDLATLLALYRLVRARATTRLAPLVAALLWAVNPYVLGTSVNGLETSIACCMFALVLHALDRAAAKGPGALAPARMARLGALLGLAMLARLDLVLLTLIATVQMALIAARGPAPWRSLRIAVRAAGLATFLVTAPWWLYSWHWTGTLDPVSGHAVRYMELTGAGASPGTPAFYATMLRHAAGAIARWNAVLLAGTGLVLLVALVRRRAGAGPVLVRAFAIVRPATPGLAFALLLFLTYAFVVFGHWHFARYLFPIALPLTWTFALALDALAPSGPDSQSASGRVRWAIPLLLFAVVAIGLVVQPSFRRLYGPIAEARGYRAIGEWAQDRFPAGTRIGAAQSGAIGYFAPSLTVVNLDGVVNRDFYEHMRRGRALDYVRGAGIRWLIWQDDIEWLVRETAGVNRAEIEPVMEIPNIRTLSTPWGLYRVVDAPAQSSN